MTFEFKIGDYVEIEPLGPYVGRIVDLIEFTYPEYDNIKMLHASVKLVLKVHIDSLRLVARTEEGS